jgi:hypothetical protein
VEDEVYFVYVSVVREEDERYVFPVDRMPLDRARHKAALLRELDRIDSRDVSDSSKAYELMETSAEYMREIVEMSGKREHWSVPKDRYVNRFLEGTEVRRGSEVDSIYKLDLLDSVPDFVDIANHFL